MNMNENLFIESEIKAAKAEAKCEELTLALALAVTGRSIAETKCCDAEKALTREKELRIEAENRCMELAMNPPVELPKEKEVDLSPIINQNKEIISLLKQCIDMPLPPLPEIIPHRGSDGRLVKLTLK